MEHFCFPDSTHWPPPLQTAGEPYTIVLTDSKGDRMYGYCRRVVPEGAQTCIPITYCLLSRHRAAGFYNKVNGECELHQSIFIISSTNFIKYFLIAVFGKFDSC
jgi:hypothetical protein